VIFTLMLSQTLAAATEALYARADLDLLFSSPIAPRKVLTVRFAAVATMAFSAIAVFVTPFLLPVIVLGHPAWLAVYLVLFALALAASAAGLCLAMVLFRLIGPRRTRAVAQVLAALIGAAFFLAAQARNLLGADKTKGVAGLVIHAAQGQIKTPPLADWPLRAMLGQPLPLLAVMAVGAGLFLSATHWIGRRFAADAAAASGAGEPRQKTTKLVGAFADGVFAVTLRKELRLMARDVPLLSQVLFRVLYMLPLMFVLLRNAGKLDTYALPAGVGAVAFVASQVAASLTWITFCAEDSPELLAAAPASMIQVWRAKLVAGLAPLGVLLIAPLIALLILAPRAGLAALVFWPATALANGLVNQWRQRQAKRTEFRRRGAASALTGFAQLGLGGLLAWAAGLAAAPSGWALAGSVVLVLFAGVLLGVLRRDEGEILSRLRNGPA
jgi:ABC-2 type transport system permease protein